MNLNVEIGFEQLLHLVKQLPAKQKKQLVEAIQKEDTTPSPSPNNLQELLLTGPVWTEEEHPPGKLSDVWNEAAARQFLNGYSEADSIYDEI